MCGSKKYIHTPPMEGHWKFLGGAGRGVLKAKPYEQKYEAIQEFPGGREGAKQETVREGSMDIF